MPTTAAPTARYNRHIPDIYLVYIKVLNICPICAGLAVPTGPLEPAGSGHVLEGRDAILGHEPRNKRDVCAFFSLS